MADFDGTNVTIYQGRNIKDSETLTQEFNLTGDVGPLDVVLGLYYLNEEFRQDLSINEPNGNGAFQPGALLSFVTPYYDSEAVAAFTDITWTLTEDLRLIGGLRVSEETQNTAQDFNIFATIQVAPATFITLGNQCNSALPELSFSSTTPRIGAQYDVNDSGMVYATYSQGLKVGGYNTEGTCNDPYLPEEVEAFEIGWRQTLFGGDVTLNTTGFFYDYQNLQLQQIIGTGVSIINAPKAEILGLELEGRWSANDNLSLFGTLVFLDATYTEFSNPDGASGSATPVDVSGNRLNSAPEVSINAGFEFEPDFKIATGALSLRSDVSYRSETFLREFNNPQERQAPYTVVNASLTWTSANEGFAIRGFATNLFDAEYLTQSQWAGPTNSRTVSWGQPLQYGVELMVDF